VTLTLPTREKHPGTPHATDEKADTQDVEVSIQMPRSIDVRGVSECETFRCDRTMCHHESCSWVGLER